MKKVFIIVFVLLIIVTIIVLLILKSKQNEKYINVSNIENLRFFYTKGYMINSDICYELDCKDKCILTYKAYGVSFNDAKKYKVSSNNVLEIENILNKYQVFKWNGFHSNDKNVLDGDSFSMYITMKNGNKIESSGYMKWPKDYGEVKKELEAIFEKIINN